MILLFQKLKTLFERRSDVALRGSLTLTRLIGSFPYDLMLPSIADLFPES